MTNLVPNVRFSADFYARFAIVFGTQVLNGFWWHKVERSHEVVLEYARLVTLNSRGDSKVNELQGAFHQQKVCWFQILTRVCFFLLYEPSSMKWVLTEWITPSLWITWTASSISDQKYFLEMLVKSFFLSFTERSVSPLSMTTNNKSSSGRNSWSKSSMILKKRLISSLQFSLLAARLTYRILLAWLEVWFHSYKPAFVLHLPLTNQPMIASRGWRWTEVFNKHYPIPFWWLWDFCLHPEHQTQHLIHLFRSFSTRCMACHWSITYLGLSFQQNCEHFSTWKDREKSFVSYCRVSSTTWAEEMCNFGVDIKELTVGLLRRTLNCGDRGGEFKSQKAGGGCDRLRRLLEDCSSSSSGIDSPETCLPKKIVKPTSHIQCTRLLTSYLKRS